VTVEIPQVGGETRVHKSSGRYRNAACVNRVPSRKPQRGRKLDSAMPQQRRFPPPWTAEEADACFIVRDANGQALAYVYFEESRGGARRYTY
jgi:hypothetical protein